jgi:spore maturation protein SpmB
MQNIVINPNSGSEVVINRYVNTTPAPNPVWDRPPSWLPMPNITGVEDLIAILYPVDDASFNTITTPAITGNYIVDWGDGNVENFASGTSATHSYVFANMPQGSQTPLGYRQALVTITPQAGNSLTSMEAFQSQSCLDFVASGTNLLINSINTNPRLEHMKLLCKVSGTTAGNTAVVLIELAPNVFSTKATLASQFSTNYSMVYVDYFDTGSISNFSNTFNNCSSLKSLPNINFNNATDMRNCFSGCRSLQSLPNIQLLNVVSFFNNPFATTSNLEKINITGQISNMNGLFSVSRKLTTFPALDMSVCVAMAETLASFSCKRFLGFGMRNSFSLAYSSLGRTELVEVFTNLGNANTGATLDITFCPGTASLTNDDKLIATNKGWTLTTV